MQAMLVPLQVYALDLLGQGESAKPVIDYSMELWRDQIVDFMSEFVQAPAGGCCHRLRVGVTLPGAR